MAPLTKDYDSRCYAMFPVGAIAKMRSELAASPENLDPDDVFGAMADTNSAHIAAAEAGRLHAEASDRVVTSTSPPRCRWCSR